MPNWMEGTFRARGKLADLKKFLSEGVRHISYGKLEVDFDDHDNGSWVTFSGYDPTYGVALNCEKRHYICCGDEGFNIIKFKPSTDEFYFATPLMVAWGIHRDSLNSLAKQYNIDIKVNGFERGMCAEEWYEVFRDGSIRQDSHTYFDNYGWEGTMPCLGG